MKSNRTNKNTTAVIEIARSHLLATIIRTQGNLAEVRTREIPWRKEATSLATDAGAREFAFALKALVLEEKLAGSRAGICLSEDYCVTRVASGQTDRVRRELSQLEERSSLYLSLGAGPKSYARAVRSIDARHQHALLSVTNRRVLETINRSGTEAGLDFEIVEPALVALSRCAKQLGRDLEQPVMIVNCGEESFELGISHQGQLLLDYRPGGRNRQHDVAAVLNQHLTRLDRYCQRYFRFPAGSLKRVLLCGSPEVVTKAQAGFAHEQRLQVEVLTPMDLESTWSYESPTTDSRFTAAMGTQLVVNGVLTSQTPNFMERIKAETRAPLLPMLGRAGWPFAAALLVCGGLWGVTIATQGDADALAAEVKLLDASAAKTTQFKQKITAADNKIRHLKAIQKKLTNPAWQDLVTVIGQCMPNYVWLENVTVQGDGKVNLAGASFDEGGVYEFIQNLKQLPLLTQVALEQTLPANLPTGPATRFDLNCDLAGRTDPVKKEGR